MKKIDFKSKKTIIAASTVAVVVLGVFVGVKVMLKAGVSNALNANSTTQKQQQSTNDDKIIADSLKQKTEDESGKKDGEASKSESDKSKETDTTDKTSDKDKTTTSDSSKDSKDSTENANASTNKNIKDVKVYDDKYIVKKGDTLYTIGKRFFVEKELLAGIDLIKKINTLNNADVIKEGDKLYIPIGTNFDKKTIDASAQKYKSYIVKKGDTLTGIAKEEMEWCDASTGVRLLREANNIVNDTIKENQKLIIPTKTTEGN